MVITMKDGSTWELNKPESIIRFVKEKISVSLAKPAQQKRMETWLI